MYIYFDDTHIIGALYFGTCLDLLITQQINILVKNIT